MPRLLSSHLGPVTGRLVQGAPFLRCVRLTSGRRCLRLLQRRARYRLPPSPCPPWGRRQRGRQPDRLACPRELGPTSLRPPRAPPCPLRLQRLRPLVFRQPRERRSQASHQAARPPQRTRPPSRRRLPLRLRLPVFRLPGAPSQLPRLARACPAPPIQAALSPRPSRSRRLQPQAQALVQETQSLPLLQRLAQRRARWPSRLPRLRPLPVPPGELLRPRAISQSAASAPQPARRPLAKRRSPLPPPPPREPSPPQHPQPRRALPRRSLLHLLRRALQPRTDLPVHLLLPPERYRQQKTQNRVPAHLEPWPRQPSQPRLRVERTDHSEVK